MIVLMSFLFRFQMDEQIFRLTEEMYGWCKESQSKRMFGWRNKGILSMCSNQLKKTCFILYPNKDLLKPSLLSMYFRMYVNICNSMFNQYHVNFANKWRYFVSHRFPQVYSSPIKSSSFSTYVANRLHVMHHCLRQNISSHWEAHLVEPIKFLTVKFLLNLRHTDVLVDWTN